MVCTKQDPEGNLGPSEGPKEIINLFEPKQLLSGFDNVLAIFVGAEVQARRMLVQHCST